MSTDISKFLSVDLFSFSCSFYIYSKSRLGGIIFRHRLSGDERNIAPSTDYRGRSLRVGVFLGAYSSAG